MPPAVGDAGHRLFVAIELPDAVRARVAERVRALRKTLPPARWVSAERLHLTLSFLGEVEAARVDTLRKALDPVFVATPSLPLRLGAAGTFPPTGRARVAWIAVEDDGAPEGGSVAGGRLESVERATRRAAALALDRPLDERPYHAHVTVARPRLPWGRAPVLAFRRECGRLGDAWTAERAVLMESWLGRSDAPYEVLEAYPLRGRAA